MRTAGAALVACGLAAFAAAAEPDAWQGDLRPLPAEEWSEACAAHLLERAGFGGTPAQVTALAADGPERAVRRLVRWQQQPNVPLPAFRASGIFPSEAFSPPTDGELPDVVRRAALLGSGLGVDLDRRWGEPWLQPLFDQYFFLIFANALETTRLAHWQADRMLRTERPLEEKLALFWHGHFATESEKVRDYRKMKAQWDLFRAHGNGSFRELLLAVARDPAMLVYLDGARNVRGQPNENFAREIFELFSLGVGHYGERDIREAARAFTGWGLDDNRFASRWWRHDHGVKSVLGRTGRLGGEEVVDAILAQPAAAPFLVRKLYRFFVREELAPEVEAELAAGFRASGYQLAPLLERIFRSRDFYSAATRGAHVKSPVELIVGSYRRLGLAELPGLPVLGNTAKQLGQGLFEPPNVAGWRGGRSWLNPSTLTGRQNFVRHALFPQEIPPLPAPLHELIVSSAIGPELYAQMKRLDEAGRRGEPPRMEEGAPGIARQNVDDRGLFDVTWAIWNGAEQALQRVRFDGFAPARVSVAALVREAGARDADAAVGHLAARFALPLAPAERRALADHLAARMGSRRLDFEREATEADLREVLHLLLSLPEYQVS
jgi:hypothetical protein